METLVVLDIDKLLVIQALVQELVLEAAEMLQ